ncbi:mitochondrial intermediate peptidase [Fistulina hepatica ATCC 64428]|uniref:Mitochondrial intermediate peptidase n=1 Tax=Fistulina hepatica ATCC 64428 TaxID=1128425 RepID=A0A0D7AKI7_9AGAR|nr:mitochondrial intermediate peptidase [Fistulina hepatica ATCC 64428]
MLARSTKDALAHVSRRAPRSFRRSHALHSSATSSLAQVLLLKPASTDDRTLISLFDRPQKSSSLTGIYRTGIFGHTSLTHPRALLTLAESTLVRAHLLSQRVHRAADSRSELFKVVKNLDRLSDLLCGVIDLCEIIRNAHPDRAWVDAATQAYERLCEFMNVLNTDVALHRVLRIVLSDPEIVASLPPEAYQTAMIFWGDFEKSAIHLPPEQRTRFVEISSEIIALGSQFLKEANTPRPPASIKPSELVGLKDGGLGVRLKLQAQFTQRDLLIYPGSLQAQLIMQAAPQEEPRRRVYMATYSSTPEQIDTLERLLEARARLARLCGHENYAEMTLDDKMAKSPTNVQYFLDAIMDHTRPFARSALRTLSMRKQEHLKTPPLPTIQAWDRNYYCPPEPPAPPIPLPPLTLGTIFMTLSRLFTHLYGISLRPAPTAPGEVWHFDVQKLEVVDEDRGVIGWIYADLFARHGKPSGAAHYTVRCSRRTDQDDEDGDFAVDDPRLIPSKEFESVKRHRLVNYDGVYQLPLVVLVTDFVRPSRTSGPRELEWHEVMTLFHEMGHAMHSMIGRTEYQNVSGTRCATDFCELPSILMEHFSNSPQVLALMDVDGNTASHKMGNHHADPCHSIDTYSQLILAALDQLYHSSLPYEPGFDTTKVLAELHKTRGLLPYVPGTSQQTQFGHLFGYGAMYYSYMFDRAIASRVWKHVFAEAPLSREQGEKFKNEVLRYGGGKDPWKMVASVLDSPDLEPGDTEAMAKVGRWKIEDEVGVPGRH